MYKLCHDELQYWLSMEVVESFLTRILKDPHFHVFPVFTNCSNFLIYIVLPGFAAT